MGTVRNGIAAYGRFFNLTRASMESHYMAYPSVNLSRTCQMVLFPDGSFVLASTHPTLASEEVSAIFHAIYRFLKPLSPRLLIHLCENRQRCPCNRLSCDLNI